MRTTLEEHVLYSGAYPNPIQSIAVGPVPRENPTMPTNLPITVAVLDDYQGVALQMADWSVLQGRAEVTVFHDHLSEPDAVVARLQPFDVVCVMRERTP